jgi:hypothetical protein
MEELKTMTEDEFVITRAGRYRMPDISQLCRADHQQLFDLELEMHEKIHNVCSEFLRVTSRDRSHRFSYAMPQVLLDILITTDEVSAELAAKVFLESRGYKVEEIRNDA